MRKAITMTVEFTDEEVAKHFASEIRGYTNGVRHVECTTDHFRYQGEMDRVAVEMADQGLEFVTSRDPEKIKTRDPAEAVRWILERDGGSLSVRDKDTGDTGVACFVLGNEKGVALADWWGKPDGPVYKKLEQVSRVVARWYDA